MRSIGLGDWGCCVWLTVTIGLCALALGVCLWAVWSLVREALPRRMRGLRWSLMGWSATASAVLSLMAWPYLTAFSSVKIDISGGWSLKNYFGITVARVPASELRCVHGEDLGGLGRRAGRMRIERADGRFVDSVRVSGARFDAAFAALGYTPGALSSAMSGVVTAPHVWSSTGPRYLSVGGGSLGALASRGSVTVHEFRH